MTVMAPTERHLVRRAPSSGDPRACPYCPLLELVDEETRCFFVAVKREYHVMIEKKNEPLAEGTFDSWVCANWGDQSSSSALAAASTFHSGQTGKPSSRRVSILHKGHVAV